MEIHDVSNLPSDSDITVILVKKSLDRCKDSKSGDGKNFSTKSSLVNLAEHKQEGKDETSSTLTPVSSWDVGSIKAVDVSDLATRTQAAYSLYQSEHLFRITESPKSSQSLVALNTIQSSYADSEPEDSPECNKSTFVDVCLAETSAGNAQSNKRPSVMDEPEMKRKSKTSFGSCFSCIYKSKSNEDD